MGNIYSDSGAYGQHVGSCDNGMIFSGSTYIGKYENGYIYNHLNELVGFYGGGNIYNTRREFIGSYDNSWVYSGSLRSVVGSYDGDPAGAAALLLLFKNPEVRDVSNNDGCLSTLWNIVVVVFLFALKLLQIALVYYTIPMFLSFTWLGWAAIIVFVAAKSMTFFIIASITTIFQILIIPYYIMAIIFKIKTHCSTKTFLLLFWKWFLKGPFAYKDLIALKRSENNKQYNQF